MGQFDDPEVRELVAEAEQAVRQSRIPTSIQDMYNAGYSFRLAECGALARGGTPRLLNYS